MATYFYMRISTQEERGVQKYSRQENALQKYAEANSIDYDEHTIYKEDRSGKNFEDREEWKKLERILRKKDTVVFKDLSRFTREAENGYQKYMELKDKGINLVFLDNPTISTDYIKQLIHAAEDMNLIAQISIDNTVKLLLYVELDRVEQERLILQKRIKDGMEASDKKPGRKVGAMDKLTPELETDIKKYIENHSPLQIDLMRKHGICRNTLKRYIKYYQTLNK